MMTPETLRVKATDPETQGPFVVINAADFDEAIHTLYEAPAEADPAPVKAGRKAKAEAANVEAES